MKIFNNDLANQWNTVLNSTVSVCNLITDKFDKFEEQLNSITKTQAAFPRFHGPNPDSILYSECLKCIHEYVKWELRHTNKIYHQIWTNIHCNFTAATDIPSYAIADSYKAEYKKRYNKKYHGSRIEIMVKLGYAKDYYKQLILLSNRVNSLQDYNACNFPIGDLNKVSLVPIGIMQGTDIWPTVKEKKTENTSVKKTPVFRSGSMQSRRDKYKITPHASHDGKSADDIAASKLTKEAANVLEKYEMAQVSNYSSLLESLDENNG